MLTSPGGLVFRRAHMYHTDHMQYWVAVATETNSRAVNIEGAATKTEARCRGSSI